MVLNMADIALSKIIPVGGKARECATGVGWRRRSESNRCIEVLQTSALPLGYAAGPKSMYGTRWPKILPGGQGAVNRGLNGAGRPPEGSRPTEWSGKRESNPRLQPWQGCKI